MNAAEYKIIREWLGVTVEWLSGWLDVEIRTIRHWEAGKFPIPAGVADEMRDLVKTTQTCAEKIEDVADDEGLFVTYRTDGAFRSDFSPSSFPASWHRAIVGRLHHELPDMQIIYREDS